MIQIWDSFRFLLIPVGRKQNFVRSVMYCREILRSGWIISSIVFLIVGSIVCDFFLKCFPLHGLLT